MRSAALALAALFLGALLLLPSLAGTATRQAPAFAESFVVGIVEANGDLVPVAESGTNGWTSSWPADAAPEQAANRTREFGDWTLWYENSGPIENDSRITYDWTDPLEAGARPFRPTGLVTSSSVCSTNLALATGLDDRTELIVCDICCPGPKRGIATTGATAPVLAERVDSSDEEGSAIATLIGPIFDQLERTAILESIESGVAVVDGRLPFTGHPVDDAARSTVSIRIDTVFRVPLETVSLYYAEARRNYGPGATEEVPCPGYSHLRTWLLPTLGPRRAAVFDPDFRLVDCDMKGAEFDRPIAYWPTGTRTADVLFRRLGWESESYGIVTVGADGVNIETLTPFRR